MAIDAQEAVAARASALTVSRLVQRVVIVGIGLAFLLTAYSKMGGRAEDMVAQVNLSVLKPLVHAYGVEHGDYSGMTLEGLRAEFGPTLDARLYVVNGSSADDFCIESTQDGRTWHLTARQDAPLPGPCGPLPAS